MQKSSSVCLFLALAVTQTAIGAGCRSRATAESTSATTSSSTSAPAAKVDAVAQKSGVAGHDPAHPPIDCPLRKHGIDPTQLRPFKDAEKYIAFLEHPDRAAWQKPDDVVKALALKGTETVYDLGAGSGYFTFRFSKALSAGKVVAADTQAEMVRHIHHRAMSKNIRNVEAKLIRKPDPGVPAGADVVFVCDVLHHVMDRPAWLGKLASQMKKGARLVLIEFKEGKLPQGPPEAAKIPRVQLVKLASRAGLVLASERKDLLPYQLFLVFRKP